MHILIYTILVHTLLSFICTLTDFLSNIMLNFRMILFSYACYNIKVTVCTLMIKKNLLWNSHNFLLPYITVEEYFIISIIFLFNLYSLWFVLDESVAFMIIVYNFVT